MAVNDNIETQPGNQSQITNISPFIRRIEKASLRLNEAFVIIISIMTVIIILTVVADVTGRYAFNNPITGALEFEQWLLSWLAFMGFAYALIVNQHIRVTLVLGRLPQRAHAIAEIIAGVAGIAFFLWLTVGGIGQFWDSWIVDEIMPSSVKFPFWLAKLMLPVGAILITVQFLIHILHNSSILYLSRRTK